MFDELSVAKLWPLMKQDEQFVRYFPSRMRKGLLPRRDYFFNILNTIHPEYVERMIDHANDARHAVGVKQSKHDYIEISEAWYEKLHQSSFVSCK